MSRVKIIFLDAPQVGKEEKEYLCQAIDSSFVSTIGPFVGEFADKFAKYLNVKKAVPTQSGTAALHVALHELGIGNGDEVIVPALTFVATVNPVVYVGAKPVFVDVDPSTWTIDVTDVERKITKKTKAIIPVHLFGSPCDMSPLLAIAKKYGLKIIEDATESLGGKYKNKMTGTFGDYGCFSFNGNKTITTGGGGMIVGRDARRLDHAKYLVNQARDESGEYFHSEVGFNYRMTNLEAAVGLAQLNRLPQIMKKKNTFRNIYKREFSDTNIVLQGTSKNAEHSAWMTVVKMPESIDVCKVQRILAEKNVQSRRVFMPIVCFPTYKKLAKGSFKNSFDIYQQGLCLPSSMLNSEEDVQFVCKILKNIVI